MAFTNSADVRTQVKEFLDIPSGTTTWDSFLEDSADRVVKKLSPVLLKELTPDTSATLTADTNSVALPAGITEVRWLELKDATGSSGAIWRRYTGFYQQDDDLYFDRTWSYAQTVRIFGLGEYALTDIPGWAETVILHWVQSEFYLMLSGNKRKYNHYIETSGARATDNMRDLSDYHLDRGNAELMDRVKMRGL